MKGEWKEKVACAVVYAQLGGAAAMLTLAVLAGKRTGWNALFQIALQEGIRAGKGLSTLGGMVTVMILVACACLGCIGSWRRYIQTLRKRAAESGRLQAMKGAGIAVLAGAAFALGAWMLFQAARDLVWCISLI